MHTAHASKLSPRRVLVVAGAGRGRHRLWQIVRSERALAQRLREAAMDDDPLPLVDVLSCAASQLLLARQTLYSSQLPLPCTLHSLGYDLRASPRFVGFVPEQVYDDEESPDEPEGAALVERELGPVIEGLQDDRSDFGEIAKAAMRCAEVEPTHSGLRTIARLMARRG